MRTLKPFLAALAVVIATSCSDSETEYHGFSNVSVTSSYANPSDGYISFLALGNWTITQTDDTGWYNILLTEGTGLTYYTIYTEFEANTTGSARTTRITIQDTDDSDNAHAQVVQYGTRGDGSLGSSPLVSAITGDDGTEISIEYDEKWRPESFAMTIDGTLKHSMTFYYEESDSTLTVSTTAADDLTGTFSSGYLPDMLTSETDTVGYYTMYTIIDNAVAIKVEHHKSSGEQYGESLLYYDAAFYPDDEHSADSLKWFHTYEETDNKDDFSEQLSVTYSSVSNRNQSVDVNQLLFGAEECSPYLLLSIFRNMRCSYVISEAKATDGSYTVSTQTNDDGSVNTMTVTDKDGDKTTYTFAY